MLKKYKGRYFGVKDPIKLLNLNFIYDVMIPYYPSGVVDDQVFHVESVLLCEETAGELYRNYTPAKVHYKPGSRPALEKIVNECVNPGLGERDKMMALLRFVRDLPERKPELPRDFSGGTEEEVIGRSSSYCGEQARVLVRLCQVAGMQARLVGHFSVFNMDGSILSLGHGVTEILIEGRFAYVDIRGIVIERPDGRLASAYDLMMFPEIIEKQPAHILKEIRPKYSLEKTRERFLSPRNITLISNYLIEDTGKYDYRRIYRDTGFDKQYTALVNQKTEEYKQKLLNLDYSCRA